MKRQTVITILFAIYLACVGYLCFGSGPDDMELPKTLFGIPFDKCVHFCMFMPFPVLGTFAFRNKSFWRSLALFFFLAILLAFALELLQTPLTDGRRTTDPWDLVANVGGISVGALIMIVGGLFKHSN